MSHDPPPSTAEQHTASELRQNRNPPSGWNMPRQHSVGQHVPCELLHRAVLSGQHPGFFFFFFPFLASTWGRSPLPLTRPRIRPTSVDRRLISGSDGTMYLRVNT
jgi:hypothetical protein